MIQQTSKRQRTLHVTHLDQFRPLGLTAVPPVGPDDLGHGVGRAQVHLQPGVHLGGAVDVVNGVPDAVVVPVPGV